MLFPLLVFALVLNLVFCEDMLLVHRSFKEESYVLLHRPALGLTWTLPSFPDVIDDSDLDARVANATFGAIDFDISKAQMIPFSTFSNRKDENHNGRLIIVKDERKDTNPLLLLDAQSRNGREGEYRWTSLSTLSKFSKKTMAIVLCLSPLGHEYKTRMVLDPLTKAILKAHLQEEFEDGQLTVRVEKKKVKVQRDDYYIGSWYNRPNFEKSSYRHVHMFMDFSGKKELSALYLGRNIPNVPEKIVSLGFQLPIPNTLTNWEVSEYETVDDELVLRVLHLYGPTPLPANPDGPLIELKTFQNALAKSEPYEVEELTRHLLEMPALEGLTMTMFHGVKAAGIISVRQHFGALWILLASRDYNEGGWANFGGLIDPADYEMAHKLGVDAYAVASARETREESFRTIDLDPAQVQEKCAPVGFYSPSGSFYSFHICSDESASSATTIRRNSLLYDEIEEANNFLWVSLEDILEQTQHWEPHGFPNLLWRQVRVLNADDTQVLRMDLKPYVYMASFLKQCQNLGEIAESVALKDPRMRFMNDAVMGFDFTHKHRVHIGAAMIDFENHRIGLLPSSPALKGGKKKSILYEIPKISNTGGHYSWQVNRLLNQKQIGKSFQVGTWDLGSLNNRHPAITFDFMEEDGETVATCTVFLIHTPKCQQQDPAVKWFSLNYIEENEKVEGFDRGILSSVPAMEFIKIWRKIELGDSDDDSIDMLAVVKEEQPNTFNHEKNNSCVTCNIQ